MSDVLAFIAIITDIKPIENADLIEVAVVNAGWQVVVKKSLHSIGEKVIFIEPDRTIIPSDNEDFEFLRKSCYREYSDGTTGFRLRTIKLRKTLSQGLIMPLNILHRLGHTKDFVDGEDVTELLSIRKYEPQQSFHQASNIKSNWPEFFPKTDEERIQNVPFYKIEKEQLYYVTEKVDGTSFSAYRYDGEFNVCSRNFLLKEEENNLYWQIANKYELRDLLPDGAVLQGEILGPSIQKNRYKLTSPELFVFGMFDIAKRKYLPYDEFFDWCAFHGIKTVPLIDKTGLSIRTTEEKNKILSGADGHSVFSSEKNKISREGLVYASYNNSDQHGKFSFKAISPSFLIKYEE